jgi:nitroimidazol reductase NimA-like FMN-containing flavoprotein (pyridoxamine 5'-phosphate oxidase superfamily)
MWNHEISEEGRRHLTAPPGTGDAGRGREPATQIVELDRGECLRLMAATTLGRLAVNVEGWPPVIRPVNYVFDQSSQSIVFRSARGSKFTALLLSAQAAFEIDGIDPDAHTGWSVIVIGMAEEITRAGEVHRLEQLGLRPLAPGDKPHWIRIRATAISGRRITAV